MFVTFVILPFSTYFLASGRCCAQPDAAKGFLLDGYPRNRGQVEHLDAFLEGRGEALDAVIELVVPREESIARLRQRATEQGRTDDTEEVIANRLAIYERETAPILDLYRERDLVLRIDGVGTLDEVTERVFAALADRGLVPNGGGPTASAGAA